MILILAQEDLNQSNLLKNLNHQQKKYHQKKNNIHLQCYSMKIKLIKLFLMINHLFQILILLIVKTMLKYVNIVNKLLMININNDYTNIFFCKK